jgi:hypothetical protein
MSEIPEQKIRLFPPPFVVSLDEGFSPERDLFGRAPIAHGLTRLVGNVDQPLVLAVDGDWGSGKTTFLRFWTGELKKAGFPVVFFDAFENDYADDPFVALAGEVFALAQSDAKKSSQTAKSFAEKATGAGKILLRSGIKIGVKAATMGALNAADLDDLASAVSDEAADVFDDNVGELITRRREDQRTVSEFRDALSGLPAKLSAADETGTHKPLIFIIDELDRCRPAFALSLLERIKHFFSVPNVHFVLGINSTQLASSVRAVYGQGIDARLYLQKFIHMNWTLSQRERYSSERARSRYVRYLTNSLGFQGKDAETADYSLKFVGAVAENRGLSFRTIEKVMAVISLAVATTPENHLRVSPLIGGLALMKVLEPDLFVKAKRGRLTFEEAKAFLGFEDLNKDTEHSWGWVESWWQYATDPDAPQEVIEQMNRGMFSYGLDRLDILPYTADTVLDNVTMR